MLAVESKAVYKDRTLQTSILICIVRSGYIDHVSAIYSISPDRPYQFSPFPLSIAHFFQLENAYKHQGLVIAGYYQANENASDSEYDSNDWGDESKAFSFLDSYISNSMCQTKMGVFAI